MYFYPEERVVVLIDGPSLSSSARALGLDIDFRKLHSLFSEAAQLVRMYFYAAVPPAGEVSTLRPLLDWLAYNRYTVVSKPLAFGTEPGLAATAMTVELSVDAMRLASSVNHIVIVSGDGNYRHLVRMLQELGVRVSIISTLKARPYVDDDLRRQADQFVDLADIANQIHRGPTVTAPPPAPPAAPTPAAPPAPAAPAPARAVAPVEPLAATAAAPIATSSVAAPAPAPAPATTTVQVERVRRPRATKPKKPTE